MAAAVEWWRRRNRWAKAGLIVLSVLVGVTVVGAFLPSDGEGERGSDHRNLTNNDESDDAGPAWSPNGRQIAFTRGLKGNSEIYVMNADGTQQRGLTDNKHAEHNPVWSPNGRQIAFETERDGNSDIYVMTADGRGQRNLTNNAEDNWWPAWSPDGRQIAFTSESGGKADIYVMSVDGSDQRRLTSHDADDAQAVWSPDGRQIAFTIYRYVDFEGTTETKAEIYVMNRDGTDQRRLTNDDESADAGPAWSPNGQQIAFTSERDGNTEVDIYVMDSDGSNQRRLTNDHEDDSPAWSPDGRQIAFTSSRGRVLDPYGRDQEIYVMNADGGDQRRLTNHEDDDRDPAWSPDGRQIAFTSIDGNSEIYAVTAPTRDT